MHADFAHYRVRWLPSPNLEHSSVSVALSYHTCTQWSVPKRSAPGPNDGNAIMWMYHSHYDESADINSGLYGPLIVYNKGVLSNTTGLPKDVDQEFVLLYLVSYAVICFHVFRQICVALQVQLRYDADASQS
jgi:hypothetical protein